MGIVWESVRERLAAAIEQRRGSLTKKVVADLAADAGIAYTTLARFLRLVEGRRAQATSRMHQTTLEAVAAQLEVSINWLLHGVPSEQRGIWPHMAPAETLSSEFDPVNELLEAFSSLKLIQTPAVQLGLCAAAASAVLVATRRSQAILSAEVYGTLARLEAQLQAAKREVA